MVFAVLSMCHYSVTPMTQQMALFAMKSSVCFNNPLLPVFSSRGQ